MKEKPEILVLCSGGLDSVTAAHLMRKRNPFSQLTLLFFEYGQRSAQQEKKYSKICARKLKAEFVELSLPELRTLSTSLITTKEMKMPKARKLSNTFKEHTIWYVPFRNTIFLSYALAYTESLALKKRKKKFVIVTGFKCEGKEPYPDTTHEYLAAMNALAKTAAPSLSLCVEAPLITMDKEDIVVLGEKLAVDFTETWSCYVGGKRQCGRCLACRLRKAGFYWANVKDQTQYVKK